MKVRVSNIQRFCLHDGPGIRTTIFLKGCNLKCPWCANPENINFEFTEFYNEITKENDIYGQDIEAIDLFKEIIKDKKYYTVNSGGVTFSGGEPLLQIIALEDLLKKLKKENINICVESALHVPTEFVELATKYVDEFIIDIKLLNVEESKKYLNGNIDLYLRNIEFLSEKNKIDVFRIPLVNEYTLKESNQKSILDFLSKYHSKRVEIFKIHNLAESKYRSMGMNMQKFSDIKDSDVEALYNEIKKINVNVKIIKI